MTAINVNTPMLQITGEPLKTEDGADAVLGEMAIDALALGDPDASPKDMSTRLMLMVKIRNALDNDAVETIELKPKDLALIIARAHVRYPAPLFAPQLENILEGRSNFDFGDDE